MDQPLQVIGIGGSLREGGYTRITLQIVLEGVEELDMNIGEFLEAVPLFSE